MTEETLGIKLTRLKEEALVRIRDEETERQRAEHAVLVNKATIFLKGIDQQMINAAREGKDSWTVIKQLDLSHLSSYQRDFHPREIKPIHLNKLDQVIYQLLNDMNVNVHLEYKEMSRSYENYDDLGNSWFDMIVKW